MSQSENSLFRLLQESYPFAKGGVIPFIVKSKSVSPVIIWLRHTNDS